MNKENMGVILGSWPLLGLFVFLVVWRRKNCRLTPADLESSLAHDVRHVERGLAFKGANYPDKTQE